EFFPTLHPILSLAASHHITNNEISKADQLASAHDRKSDEEEDTEFEHSRYDFIMKRMNNIFNEVILSENPETKKTFLTIKPLTQFELTDKDRIENLEQAKQEYKVVFNEFTSRCKGIVSPNVFVIHHQLYPLLKTYTGAIPSATYQQNNPSFKPTVSLFDHLKLTAALASVLKASDYQYGKEGQDVKLVFLEYDLSGTQDYIFQVTEGEETKRDIAKSLRTRSFFLLLLTDLIGFKLVHDFSLSYENILFSSGGRGIVLLPFLPDFEDKIQKTISCIEKEIFEKFKGKISFSFAKNVIDVNEFENNYQNIMNAQKKTVLSGKKQKFKTLFSNPKFSFVSKPLLNACELCESYEAEKNNRCHDCNDFIELNSILVNNKKIFVEYDFSKKNNTSNLSFSFQSLGNINIYVQLPEVNDFSYYVTYNGDELGESKFYANLNAKGKSFNEIADLSEGDKKLGLLKMDVDNLGLIFYKGINHEYKTFSKVLMLSRFMDYFFSKHLFDLMTEKRKNHIYINYSGGDDLVLIAPASEILSIASEINNAFHLFTSQNKDLHISSGIDIFDSKSPIRYAVLQAEAALDQSKKQEHKNSFTIFGTTINNSDMKQVIDECEYYQNKLAKKQISRSIIYKLYSAISNSVDNNNPIEAFSRFIPLLSYSFERNIDDESEKTKLRKLFVRRDINISLLNLYKVIFEYALLKTRNVKEDKNEQ
nr:type III-A CRISPR-associated protein Cas10/Csm1 [Bacilli bacterium]